MTAPAMADTYQSVKSQLIQTCPNRENDPIGPRAGADRPRPRPQGDAVIDGRCNLATRWPLRDSGNRGDETVRKSAIPNKLAVRAPEEDPR